MSASKQRDPGRAEELEALLHRHDGWRHLKARTRGKDLLIEAHDDGAVEELVRLSPVGPDQYGVSILWHNGRWQRLPVIGSLVEVVEGLRRDFAELLSAL
jgi:hypothetical protein